MEKDFRTKWSRKLRKEEKEDLVLITKNHGSGLSI